MSEGFGAFGKMPSVGDFFRINMPNGFVSGWDQWIQSAMLRAQSALGSAFDAHYMSAPIWRFSLTAGLAGSQKMIGVLMPSVDRVGRRFPLTLARAIDTPGCAALDHFNDTGLFEQLEDVALDALEDSMTREVLETRLRDVVVPAPRNAPPIRMVGKTITLTDGTSGDILPGLASGLLAGKYVAPSVWSAVVNSVPRLMICDGLPDGSNIQGLFQLDAPMWNGARGI